MPTPAKFNLKPLYVGTAIDAFLLTITLRDGVTPPSTTATRAIMEFRKESPDAPVSLRMDSDSGGISIVSGVNWQFSIPRTVHGLSAGIYYWGFLTVDDEDIPELYLEGVVECKASPVAVEASA